ncbi:glycosyltransferase family 39 protein [Candidatus Amesbacteria bacterium]|nr:glycosyltransferase family 39 protein [Candidatus Amesbacteria bacterium]
MKKYIPILLILCLATVLRIWNITSSPSGLNADEAALGYNAYSLMLTGRDEHGHPWPVNLESFGDFKPAGYAYILIPFIKVFGFTEFAVRLPSVIFGVLGVLGIYLLTKELINWQTGQLAALLLAVSPWHLHFSRGAWEVNVSTTLIVLGMWLLIKWLKDPKLHYLLISNLYFLISIYTYQSSRVIVPLLGLGIFILFFKNFRVNYKQSLLSALLLVLLLLPLSLSLITTDAKSRLSGVGLLADSGPTERAKELRIQHGDLKSIPSKLLHNRPVQYGLRFIQNYLDHFDGNFLFVNGDVIERSKVPEMGLFYLTDFIFIIIGAMYLIRNSSFINRIIWLWLLVAPVASAMTFQTPHALRAFNMVIPMIIIISLGMYQVIKYKKLFVVLIVAIYAFQISDYLYKYHVRYPKEYPAAWEYGFKELVAYTESVKDKYPKIWVTDKYDQPYILFLFYSKYDPRKFQGNHTLSFRDKFNFSTVRDYDKYHFESAPWDKVRNQHSALIVAAPEDIPELGVDVIKTINFPNGLPAFKIVSN